MFKISFAVLVAICSVSAWAGGVHVSPKKISFKMKESGEVVEARLDEIKFKQFDNTFTQTSRKYSRCTLDKSQHPAYAPDLCTPTGSPQMRLDGEVYDMSMEAALGTDDGYVQRWYIMNDLVYKSKEDCEKYNIPFSNSEPETWPESFRVTFQKGSSFFGMLSLAWKKDGSARLYKADNFEVLGEGHVDSWY